MTGRRDHFDKTPPRDLHVAGGMTGPQEVPMPQTLPQPVTKQPTPFPGKSRLHRALPVLQDLAADDPAFIVYLYEQRSDQLDGLRDTARNFGLHAIEREHPVAHGYDTDGTPLVRVERRVDVFDRPDGTMLLSGHGAREDEPVQRARVAA